MKNFWETFGRLILVVIIWCSILIPETMYGVVYARSLASIIVGISSLLFLTFEPSIWFNVKGLREWTFGVLGVINIVLGVAILPFLW